jgi:tRNA(adenine34) deaminase
MEDHHYYMGKALELAQAALQSGEFPVGCVITLNGRIVAQGGRTGTAAGRFNEIDHAEMAALRQLSASVDQRGQCRQATLYCTLEPCLMCCGAALISGIGRLVFGYEDAMGGGIGFLGSGTAPLYREAEPTVVAGVRRRESLALFQAYFSDPQNRYWQDSLLARYTLAQSTLGQDDNARRSPP